jgi:hypothetical protein
LAVETVLSILVDPQYSFRRPPCFLKQGSFWCVIFLAGSVDGIHSGEETAAMAAERKASTRKGRG